MPYGVSRVPRRKWANFRRFFKGENAWHKLGCQPMQLSAASAIPELNLGSWLRPFSLRQANYQGSRPRIIEGTFGIDGRFASENRLTIPLTVL